MGLSQRQATTQLSHMVDNAIKFGGCITINWHDRSLAAERLWESSYRNLIQDLKNRGAWFATAGQTTSWFRKRRSVEFDEGRVKTDGQSAGVFAERKDGLPGCDVRIHRSREPDNLDTPSSERYTDFILDEQFDEPIQVGRAAESFDGCK
jgi:hypothetical protein